MLENNHKGCADEKNGNQFFQKRHDLPVQADAVSLRYTGCVPVEHFIRYPVGNIGEDYDINDKYCPRSNYVGIFRQRELPYGYIETCKNYQERYRRSYPI